MASGTRKASTGTSGAGEALKQLTYLAAALKAPRITEAAARLADHARDAGWTHEEYLAAVLDREVAARNASGAQLRIRAAGFAARKTLEEFDWDAQPSVRQQVAALACETIPQSRQARVILDERRTLDAAVRTTTATSTCK